MEADVDGLIGAGRHEPAEGRGCGISTLLRMIAGLEEITGGIIAIGGRVINGVGPKHRDIARVFQIYNRAA